MVSDAWFRRRTKHAVLPAMLVVWMWVGPAAVAAEVESEGGISLVDAVREALVSSPDLLTRQRELAAAREEIGLARSALLPQVGVGARAQILEDDRPDGARGSNESESILVAAGLQQVLYDEETWARFQIQKHVYDGQVLDLESFRLGVIQGVAAAFLDSDRARSVLAIQERNREITRRNRETSRSRIAAGWSSDREVLRWDLKLATNDADVRSAEVRVLKSRFDLNRARGRAPEAPTKIQPATIETYGFVYTRAPITAAAGSPEGARRVRDFFVRFGLQRSPELAAIDTSIAAAERQLTANRRAFFVPTLSLAAGVDHLASQNSGDDVEKTEWGVKGVATFPLFQGGAKIAGYDQARESLSGLRMGRRATAQSLERSIRASLAQASGAYDTVGFTQAQVEAARRNFELVDSSYTLGVASILDLLDAQDQLLRAELALQRAIYGFLGDVIAAERALNYYPFLEPEGEVEGLLGDLERALAARSDPD